MKFPIRITLVGNNVGIRFPNIEVINKFYKKDTKIIFDVDIKTGVIKITPAKENNDNGNVKTHRSTKEWLKNHNSGA